MRAFYVITGLIIAIGLYETVVKFVNTREGDLHEDARRNRVRTLNQDGDIT